jgi:hypothetical protein
MTFLSRIRNYFHPPRFLTADEVRRMRLTCPQFAHMTQNFDPSRHKVIWSREPLSAEQVRKLCPPNPAKEGHTP